MVVRAHVEGLMRDLRALLASAIVLVGLASSAYADTAQYYYDPAGRLVGVIDPVNGSSVYTLDATGNILSVATNPVTALVVVATAPQIGTVNTGITIAGTGFGTTSNTTVSFNGVTTTPTAVTATSINVKVPTGATSGPVKVIAPGGTVTAAANFVVGVTPVPTVGSIPTSVTVPGASVTITGTNFDPLLTNDKIFVNNQAGLVTAATATSLTFVVPQASTGPIEIETPLGSSTSSAVLVVAPPGFAASSVNSSKRVTVPAISTGVSTSGAVSAANGVALLYFSATAGQRVTTLIASNSNNGSIALYGPNGTQIASSSLSVNGFFDAPSLQPSGTYTLAINSSVVGSTTFTLYNASDITSSIAANGTPVSLTTIVPGQNMSLTFSGTAGQRISLLTQVTGQGSLGGVSSPLVITEPDGVTQIFSTCCFNSSSWFSGVLVLPTTGTYNIVANPSNVEVGTVAFTLYTVPTDASATIATNGTAVPLTTTVPGQNFALTFTGTAGQRISLTTQISGSGTLGAECSPLIITEPDGATQIYSTNCYDYSSWFSGVVVLPVAGTYKINAYASGAGVGTMNFTLYTVPSDASSTISATGSAVSLTTTAPGQNFALTFTGSANQRISLVTQISGSGSLGAECSPITIIEPDGVTQLYSNGCYDYSSWFSGVIVLPAAGTYTIHALASGAGIGTMNFTLYTVPADATAVVSANGTATSLTTATPGQNFSLTFSGTAAQKISLATQIESGSLGASCSGLTITEPDGATQLYSNGCYDNTNWFSDVISLPVAGTYTIVANASGPGVGTMQFTLYTVPSDASATITPGATVSLSNTVPGQNLDLTFTANAGGRIAIFSENTFPNWCFLAMNVLAPDGVTNLYSHDNCGYPIFSGALPTAASVTGTVPTLATSGTYTLSLNPSGADIGTAQVTLYSVPPDVTGTTTIGAAAATYSTTTPAQAARVTFTGTASQSVTVGVGETSSNPSGGCYQITVLEPDGSTVLRGDSSCNAMYSSGSLTLPTSGKYLVVVGPTGTTTGTYTVGVTTP